jgi:hypothetical protein
MVAKRTLASERRGALAPQASEQGFGGEAPELIFDN